MNRLHNFLQKLTLSFQKAGTGNEPWQFFMSVIILVGGLILLEIIFRYARRRIQTSLETKGFSPETWNLSALLPSFRLASTALLVRIAEGLLMLPDELIKLLRGIEGLLLALAFILLFFYLVEMIDRLRFVLPSRLQHEFPETVYTKLKNILRIFALIGVALVFIYTQKNFFPEWLWGHSWWRYLLILIIIVVIYQLIRLVATFLEKLIVALKESPENLRLQMVLQATIWPLRILLSCIAIFAVKEMFALPTAAGNFANMVINILGTLAVIIFIYRLIEVMVYELKKITDKEDNLLDETFIQMMRMLTRLVVLIFGAIYLIQTISGKPLSALLAGLGIGGLAVALAAQDTLKNFFGSIMIMLDKPFKVGQRVVVGDHDGIIEEIGFRSTRVRTLTGHLVSIPNEKMAGSNIENIAQRPSIRRLTNITITYDTPPEKVEKALSIIKEILNNHEGMHPDFPPRVFFNEFNDTSLNILMIYWYHPPNYWDFLAFNEKVNLQIMRAYEKEGIEFAFPTTTAYLAQDDRRPLNINFSGNFPDINRET